MPAKRPSSSRKAPTRRSASRTTTRSSPTPAPSPIDSPRRADVVLDLELDRGRMNLVLANCGDAVATDIHVDFSRSLRGLDDASPVSDLPLFKRLGVLRPGVTLRVFWNTAAIITQREHAASFIATVSWTESNGATRRAEFRHDPSIFRHWPQCE